MRRSFYWRLANLQQPLYIGPIAEFVSALIANAFTTLAKCENIAGRVVGSICKVLLALLLSKFSKISSIPFSNFFRCGVSRLTCRIKKVILKIFDHYLWWQNISAENFRKKLFARTFYQSQPTYLSTLVLGLMHELALLSVNSLCRLQHPACATESNLAKKRLRLVKLAYTPAPIN